MLCSLLKWEFVVSQTHFNAFKKALEKRSVDTDFDKLKDLDKINREFIQKKENLEKENIHIEHLENLEVNKALIFSKRFSKFTFSNHL